MEQKNASVGSFLKHRLAGVWEIVSDALIDNSDYCAKGRRGMLFGNYVGAFTSTLINGIYFTGLMLYMGASDVYIGYITLLGSICTFLQLLAPLLMERLKRRKTILMASRGFMFFLNIVVIGIIPILPIPQTLRLALFMTTVLIVNLINHFSSSAFNAWHLQVLPLERRANYFTLSSLGTSVIATATGFFAGVAADGIEASGFTLFDLSPEYLGFLLLRLFALLSVILEFKFFLQIPERPYETDEASLKIGFNTLLLPLKNKGFMMMVIVPFFWNLLAGFIGPYFNVYLLEKANMSYTYISLAGFIGLPMTIVFTPVWARLIQRYSWFKMLVFALFGYSITFLANPFITESTQFIYIVSCAICNVFTPCVSLNLSNIEFVKMPPANQTAFLSFYTAFTAVGTILGNFLGTQFFSATEGLSFQFVGLTFTNYQWFPLVQFVLMMILVVYVIYIRRLMRKDRANDSLNL